jgi:hypothetical protein
VSDQLPEFRLQPSEEELSQFAEDYWETSSDKDKKEESEAFEAGRAILFGDRSPEALRKIVYWKSPRVVHYLETNSPEKIKSALDVAVAHVDTRDALKALQELRGVAIPVASAILTTIHPDRYTIIDFSALEALGYFQQDEQFYIAYLEFCRTLSVRAKVSPQAGLPGPTALHALDRALWQWSASQGL